MTYNRKHQTGMSMMEVLAALVIVGTMIMASVVATTAAHKMTRINSDKEFAVQKAISLIEEMKGLVQVNSNGSITSLETFDDGAGVTNPVLTIQGTHLLPTDPTPATKPDDPISGNIANGSGWMYERHITVTTPPGQPASNDVRLVDVQVYRNTGSGKILLAEVSSVIRTIITSMPPTQVYDVYAIAIENVPGWWVYMSNVVQVVKNAITNLQARNPGLEFRQHWISTLAYGRDQEYRPYLNETSDSKADIDYAYFYPGRMPDPATNPDVGNNYYYFPSFFKGHVLVDSADTNGYDVATNPYPYALADQYNHAMRYEDENALYLKRLSANPDEERTLRLLLEDMYRRPDQYINALVINLHGELMPFPPIRNYSDAAKDPEQIAAPDLRNVRVVTHPENLRYSLNANPVRFRVYSYLTNPDAAGLNNLPAATPITLVIHGTNAWIPAAGEVTAINGGLSNAGAAVPYSSANAAVCAGTPPAAGVMCYTWALTGVGNKDTTLKLYNSPLRAPFDTATGMGIEYASRLYNMEYIPSPVENLTVAAPLAPFTTNLTSVSPLPKNTARWVLSIPSGLCPAGTYGPPSADGLITVETRIGDQTSSGVVYPAKVHPANLSRTYAWRGDDTWIFGDLTTTPVKYPNLPITERYQFQGDPRHCPYADLKRPYTGTSATAANESLLGMGYNRNFDNFEDPKYNGSSYAQVIGSVAGAGTTYTFPITSTTNKIALKTVDAVNGTKSIPAFVVSGTNGNIAASTLATNMNNNSTFKLYAVADIVNGHIRIMPKSNGPASTIQIDTANSTVDSVFGFDNLVRTAGAWVGWSYTNAAGTIRYGIKNDGTLANAGAAGWITGAGDHDVDVARLFQITRSSLIRANALWTTMTGWSYYYVGIGNEIGYDSANGFPNSVPVSKQPFDGSSGSSQYIDTITRDSGQGTYYVRWGGANSVAGVGWYSIPWLGELYPDVAYDLGAGAIDWKDFGNLPTDKTLATGYYIRDLRTNYQTFPGTDLEQSVRRTYRMGCTTMFWAGASGSTFHHTGGSSPDTGSVQTAGTDIANHYAFPVPDTMDSNRPFTTTENTPGDNPEFFLQNAYAQAGNSNAVNGTAANSAKLLNSYYQHNTSKQSSALLTLSDPTSYDTAFIVVNGLSPTGVSGTNFISNWAFLSLIQSYLNGGLYTDASAKPTAHHVRQMPRLTITSPNLTTNLKNPGSITVSWSTAWKRWDNIAYTTAYPGSYSEAGVNLTYQVMYSSTNGIPDKSKGPNETGWRYVQTDHIAEPGLLQPLEKVASGTSVLWNTPGATFPEGNYLIRVEAYRDNYPLHYSYHQFRAYISR